MSQIESLDNRIAKALTDDTTTVAELDQLIEHAHKAIATAKLSAETAEQRALDPTVVDETAFQRATENSYLAKKYANARAQLNTKREAIERKEAHAAWLVQANQVEAARDEVEAEFTSTYTSFISTFIALAERVNSVNQAASHLNITRVDGMLQRQGVEHHRGDSQRREAAATSNIQTNTRGRPTSHSGSICSRRSTTRVSFRRTGPPRSRNRRRSTSSRNARCRSAQGDDDAKQYHVVIE